MYVISIYSVINPNIIGAINAEVVIAVNLIPIPRPELSFSMFSDIMSILSGWDIPNPIPHKQMPSPIVNRLFCIGIIKKPNEKKNIVIYRSLLVEIFLKSRPIKNLTINIKTEKIDINIPMVFGKYPSCCRKMGKKELLKVVVNTEMEVKMSASIIFFFLRM